MKINWHPNPLKTTVELDEQEKRILWLKIKVEELEERIVAAEVELDSKHWEWRAKHLGKQLSLEEVIEAARRELRYSFTVEGEERNGRNFDDRVDEILGYYLEALMGEHEGDCTCLPCTCTKCCAENALGIDTIEGLGKHPGSKIAGAFMPRVKGGPERTLDEAIEHLKNYKPVNTSPNWPDADFQAHVPRWLKEAKHAYEWLLNYKATKAGTSSVESIIK